MHKAGSRKYGSQRIIIRPENLQEVLTVAYLDGGYEGRTKVLKALRGDYASFYEMQVLFIKENYTIYNKKSRSVLQALVQAIVVDKSIEQIQINLLDYQKSLSGLYNQILYYRDYFSRYSILFTLKDKLAPRVARKIDIFFRTFITPLIYQSDNGSEFKGALLLLLRLYGIKVSNGKPRILQTQGLVEAANRIVKEKIAIQCEEAQSNEQSRSLTNITYQINLSKNQSTKQTATKVLFRYSLPKRQLEKVPSYVNTTSYNAFKILLYKRSATKLQDEDRNEICLNSKGIREAFPDGVLAKVADVINRTDGSYGRDPVFIEAKPYITRSEHRGTDIYALYKYVVYGVQRAAGSTLTCQQYGNGK